MLVGIIIHIIHNLVIGAHHTGHGGLSAVAGGALAEGPFAGLAAAVGAVGAHGAAGEGVGGSGSFRRVPFLFSLAGHGLAGRWKLSRRVGEEEGGLRHGTMEVSGLDEVESTLLV